MKKYLVAFIIFLILFGSFPAKGISNGAINQQRTTDEFRVIPDEAIRLRILANSDSDSDQALKRKIRDEINEEITQWVEDITDIEHARQLIQDRLPEIEQVVDNVLTEENIEQSFEVDYGENIQFPAKVYDNLVYPAGEYEAILVTLGKGKGANWWCVLFPPLCFLDFSNGTSVAEQDQEDEASEDDEEEDKKGKKISFKFFFLEWFS
ncbi:stage II sporulation protein R [Aquibacillus albus]|uniref:Stage II sporulation protein R n=1 Tax=Aquibacillus albus TaxID=1168171 RepID=A0ABS2MZJ1_9BACI|nr:stage II sporulation protein R [Aquibacillus albus]MBM7571270.1 stage II sporulation protein R [Aquibacillus albus]